MPKIPKLIIDYSWPYDEVLHEAYRKRYTDKTYQKGERYAKRLQKEWNKISNKVFKSISKVSGLKWKEEKIRAYVVKHIRSPISFPLTLRMDAPMFYQIENIIHELVHNIMVQNNWPNFNHRFFKKYKNYKFNTMIHIPVHAILKLVFLELFGEKKTAKLIMSYERAPPEYTQAWKIVEKEGAMEIIKKLKKK